jgi:7-cyano-7-deazaguanine reductase
MVESGECLLGQAVDYAANRDASILFALARAPLRAEIGVGVALPFLGADVWNAYELSWLNMRGKPELALATLIFPAESSFMIESKSLKLYLNAYSQKNMPDIETVRQQIAADLSRVAGAAVQVRMRHPASLEGEAMTELPGLLLDRLDVQIHPDDNGVELLKTVTGEPPIEQTLVSRLLKSNCPVTGQPDWASVQIHYHGSPIDEAGLLRYLIGYRQHQAFHEQCVEQIFMDILHACQPMRLSVYARYTRRGGLDINPWRSNFSTAGLPDNIRHPRQ